jgi:hypothetical protein
MLLAYSVENILKAALVRARNSEFAQELQKSGRLPEELRKESHNLVNLAQSALNFTVDEEGLTTRRVRASPGTWV